METRGFLERVLPSNGGDYYLATVDKNNSFRQIKLPSLAALQQRVEKCQQIDGDVYFATGVYAGARAADKAALKQALYLDIDCGPGKPYPTKKEGVKALVRFCRESGMPLPSLVVDSGNGLHPYWTLSAPIPLEQWQPLANRLKDLCEEHGFDPDPSITADAARILRVPGTFNHKNAGNPLPVVVLRETDRNFSVEELAEILSPHRSSRLAQLAGEDDLDLPARQFEDRPRYVKQIISECGVVKQTYETGGENQPGMLWIQILNLLAFAADGEEYIHVMSDKHADYDRRTVEKKYFYAVKRKEEEKFGPTRCKTFEKYMPAMCVSCRHRGKITSPIQLGEDAANSLPHGFRQDKDGLHRLFIKKDGEQVWIRIAPYRFSNVVLSYDPHAEDGMDWHLSFDSEISDKVTRCSVPLASASDSRALARSLCRGGVIILDDHLGGMKVLINSWAHRMQKAKEVRLRFSQLGWVRRDKLVGFAMADHIKWEDGTTETMQPSDGRLAVQYRAEGDTAVWRELALKITSQGRPEIDAAIATAFAAPLIKFTSISGAMFSLVSQRSGTGKTSALKLAQAVWGCPRRAMHALDDTPRSIAHKLGFLNNLPSYWDEIRMAEDAQSFIRLMFQLGQGKERSRLTASASAQAMGTWTTLITVASNEFLTEYVDNIVRTSNAGRARLFEVEVSELAAGTEMIPPQEFGKLDENYGGIGHQYAEFLATNHAAVDSFMSRLWDKLATKAGMSNDERFWMATVVSVVAGATFANKLGFTNINVPVLLEYMMEQFNRLRGETAEVHVKPELASTHLLMDYVAAIRDQLIVCDHTSTKGRAVQPGVIHVQPQRGQILGYIAIKDRIMRILISEFKDWMRLQRRITNPATAIKALTQAKIAVETRGSVSCGLVNTLNAPARTLDVYLASPELRGVLVQASKAAEKDQGEA